MTELPKRVVDPRLWWGVPVFVALLATPLFLIALFARQDVRTESARASVASSISQPPQTIWPPKTIPEVMDVQPQPTYLDPSQVTPPTLNDVFGTRAEPELPLDPAKVRTLVATGDVIPGRYTDVIMRQKNDFLYPVQATKGITSNADVTVVNLEAPLIKNCPYHDSGFSFCGRQGFVAGLKALGVDVATLENNHIGNHGESGIKETKQLLEKNSIKWADRKTPAIVEVDGITFGFIAFNGVGPKFDRAAITSAVKKLRPLVDVVVVSFHWGQEYVRTPQAGGAAPDDPRKIARLTIDAGADLILGNHPHWVQAVESYKGKFIAYAHGNFIFDQMWSRETRIGVIGKYTFYGNKLYDVDFRPIIIENYAKPVPLKGKEARAVLDSMHNASKKLK
jgi:poly-gamma-glutamate capsule biosynthesis protein CapA/YwtB (metallophosphatase superfamily)